MYRVNVRGNLGLLGNAQTKEVHVLRNERSACQVEELLLSGRGVGFTPDTLAQAKLEGYELCQHCRGTQQAFASAGR
jgi:hypothetical protein